MSAHDPAFAEWIAEARKVSVRQALERRGLWSRLMVGDRGVPCPGCGGTDRFAVNAKKDLFFCRASGAGGDAIALIEHIEGLNFTLACEDLTGRPPPGRGMSETPAQRAARVDRLAAERQASAAKLRRDADQAQDFRERERKAAFKIWQAGRPIAGTLAEAYLAKRMLDVPQGALLRFGPDEPLWSPVVERVVHRGPALLAAIAGPDGRFAGVQRTWIDLAQPKGKALVADPQTGELLPAKKVRGSKRGGSIRLACWSGCHPAPPAPPRRLFLGEGTETVLSVWTALGMSPLKIDAEFLAAVDLGNMAGRAAGRVRHPEQTRPDKLGRARPVMVGNGEPDPADTAPIIPVQPSVEELVLLGDGDSDAFTTRLALERAAARFFAAYPWLTIRLAMARPGADFNGMLCNGEMAA